MSDGDSYPGKPALRSAWIVARRGEKNPVDPSRPYAFMREIERGPDGAPWETATIFLTNKECPWRCAMCDLWRNTTDATVPIGAIPNQIRFALERLEPARQLKLYNSGSFFDPAAIPREDYPVIAALARRFERVIVECHPKLVTREVLRFEKMLGTKLEIAMGLETVHPVALEKLNKRMTLGDFSRSAKTLTRAGIGVRAFALVPAPFIDPNDSQHWTRATIGFAINNGADVVSIIPTRSTNQFVTEPTLQMLEDSHDYGIGLRGARVFADLWDLRRFSKCDQCFDARARRIARMNLEQIVLPRVQCQCA